MDDSDDSSSTSSGLSNDDPIGDIGDNQMPDTKKDHEEKEEHEVQVVLTTDTENLIKKEEPPNTDRNNTAGNIFCPQVPGTSVDQTWDYSLRQQPPSSGEQPQSNNKGGTIWLVDVEFQKKLDEYSVFSACDHEVIKLPCPCPKKESFSICKKCHRVFCSNKCLKKTKETQNKEGKPDEITETEEVVPCTDTTSAITSTSPKAASVKPKSSPRTLPQPSQMSPNIAASMPYHENTLRPKMGMLPPNKQYGASMGNGNHPNPTRMIKSPPLPLFTSQTGGGNTFMPSNEDGLLGSFPMGMPNFQPMAFFQPPPPPQSMPIMNNNNAPYYPINTNQYHMGGVGMSNTLMPLPAARRYQDRRQNLPTTIPPYGHGNNMSNPQPRRITNKNLPPPPPQPHHQQHPQHPTQLSSSRNSLAYNSPHLKHNVPNQITEQPKPTLLHNYSAPPLRQSFDAQKSAFDHPPFENSVSQYKTQKPTKKEMSPDMDSLQKFRGLGRGNKSLQPSSTQKSETDNTYSSMVEPSTTAASRPQHQVFNSADTGVQVASSQFNKTRAVRKILVDSTSQNTQSKLTHPTTESYNNVKSATNFANPNTHLANQQDRAVPRQAIRKSSSQKTHLSSLSRKDVILVSDSPSDDPIFSDPYVFYGVPMQANHAYGDSLSDFYVWSGFGCNSNQSIIEELTSLGEGSLLPKTPIVGDCCIAKYTSDGVDGWFRARIIDIKDDQAQVYFIDYGNKEVVSNSLIRKLPLSLRKMRPSAIRVEIGDFRPNEGINAENLVEAFYKYILEHKFRVTIFENSVQRPTGRFEYPILKAKFEIKDSDGQWTELSDCLENEGLGHKISFDTQVFKKNENACDDYPCFTDVHREIPAKISHVNQPNDFYVIPEDNVTKRETLSTSLNDANMKFEEFKMEKWIETNYICISKRLEGIWARAKIVEITEDCTAIIRFIDFGDTVEKQLQYLKCVPANLLSIPQLAFRCSLPILPQDKWDLTDSNVTVLNDMKDLGISAIIIVFAMEFEIPAHIVEVFQLQSTLGLAKALLKKTDCLQEYEVDLDIRKKIQDQMQDRQTTDSRTEVEVANVHVPAITAPILPSQSKPQEQQRISPLKNDLLVEHELVEIASLDLTDASSEIRLPLPNIEPQKSLHEFKKSEFKITCMEGFNQLWIQPTNLADLAMHLQEVIIECVDSKNCFQAPPPLNTIVIAPYPDGNFHRGITRKISVGKKVKVMVEFIDVGNSFKISLRKLVPASENVANFPKLTYHAKLVDVDDDPQLLMSQDLDKVMDKVANITFLMDMCNGKQEPYIVSLRPKDAAEGDTISRRILAKQVWEWETVWNAGYKVDKILFSHSKYRDSVPLKVEHIEPTMLPPGLKLTGEVSRFTVEGDIYIVNITDKNDMIQRNHRVLEAQIARFVEKVAPTTFFPIIDEVILIYIPDIPELRSMNLHGVGKWNRCIRENSEYFRNFDYDEIYPINAEQSGHFLYRKLSLEFFHRVTVGVAECKLKDFKPSSALTKRMQSKLGERKSVTFMVDRYDEDNLINIITIDDF
ncbi:uncharacterized protein LOC110846177 isoform X2 [Folsomia candida]|uniref:uncharacterized protein LOC110846177 isoform X2 n=1 Tax=Folsomia candida TaxID=158441 RepID=UPI000B8F989B|nr:uncharacterized protein LOC110846177 isoform X2 [Folsomia candida]